MNLYFEMLRKPVFHVEDVNVHYGNINSARAAVKRLVRDGMAARIRNNLYTCLRPGSGCPVASRFQIASAINPSSYISHHTAMEYYGVMDQVFYEVYVSSPARFNDFEFDGYRYRFIRSDMMKGVIQPEFGGGVRVTDMERTIIDSIRDMDRIAGMEEVLSNIDSIYKNIRENVILEYLAAYDCKFLYQKTALILEHYRDRFLLSDNFFDECRKHIGRSSRYLVNGMASGKFNSRWSLVVPEMMYSMKNGVDLDADV